MKNILLFVMMVLFAVMLAGCGEEKEAVSNKQDAKQGQEKETKENQSKENLLEKINVTLETKNETNEQGRQKAVVWVKNNTDKTFTGSLGVMIWGDEMNSRGTEEFSVKQLKSGLQTYGVIWLKQGNGTKLDYNWYTTKFE